jgi:phosphatidylglycerophosphate synthase
MSTSALLSNHGSHDRWAAPRVEPGAQREAIRARRHPISRWYICPLALRLTALLARWPVRPWQLTLAGLACAIAAGGCTALPITSPFASSVVAAVLVLAAWFFDRADGMLARRLGACDRAGAWLDANTDEIVDFGLQVCLATAAAHSTASSWPWFWLVLFLSGKYLLMHGLSGEREPNAADRAAETASPQTWLRGLYHLPGNADVRVHLLAAALLTGWLTEELAFVALYYTVRWLVRYARGFKLAVEAPT